MLHIYIPHFFPCFKYGGPVKSIALLNSKLKIKRKLVTSNKSYDGIKFKSKDIVAFKDLSDVFYLSLPSQINYTMFKVNSGDKVYLNSFFHWRSSILTLMLIRLFKNRVQVFISPRGEIFDYNINSKKFKKRLYMFVFKKFLQGKNTVFIVSNADEDQAVRKYLGYVRTEILSNLNDVELAKRNVVSYSTSSKVRLVFLSRISPKKNLETCIKIVDILQQKLGQNCVEFDVFGPATDADYLHCLCKSSSVMKYRGEVLPQNVLSVLSQYDCLLFPSHSENFGHVISEGMRAGLYIATSTNTPWDILDEDNNLAGFRSKPNDAETFTSKLLAYARLSNAQKSESGIKAQEMVLRLQRSDAVLVKKYETVLS